MVAKKQMLIGGFWVRSLHLKRLGHANEATIKR